MATNWKKMELPGQKTADESKEKLQKCKAGHLSGHSRRAKR
jgi:hypothetical protein